jgi:very-short-patch-repair endonuclease
MSPATPADRPEPSTIWTVQARRRLGRQIAEISEGQQGAISLQQLRTIGLSGSAVRSRVEEGSLHSVHEGVYGVGQPLLTTKGRLMAAVLACGETAVVSHRTAAWLWGIRETDNASIDVTASNRRGRSPVGIVAHRDGTLIAADRTRLQGIPCTTVARTLLDLAGIVPMWDLRKAVAEAEVLRSIDRSTLSALIRRSRGRRGVARLRLLIDELDPATWRTRSELERRFLRMCRRAGLPPPEVNVELEVSDGRLEVDFLWRGAGLIVEADGRRYHDTASAFHRDRRREQRLQLAGWRVSRCTWAQVKNEPNVLIQTIRALLSQANTRRRD